jgi:hypothetical protein
VLACPPQGAGGEQDWITGGNWNTKVSPAFVIGIQFVRFISRLINDLQANESLEDRTGSLFIEFCRETLVLLPETPPETSDVESLVDQFSAPTYGEGFFEAPEVRRAMAEIGARIANLPPEISARGFARPHWWMQYASWRDFLKAERVAQSFLNLLAFLHFQLPLAELTQRVADGDPKLFARLFRFETKIPAPDATSEKFLAGLDDRAMQIVGRALLLKGEPQGYQLRLRMVLFFGWDFGIADLSNSELHSFLNDMKIIPPAYDPETLRRFRNRIRKLIEKSSSVKAATFQGE